MEILICGTAAAEGWPALFCTCPACAKARRNGGKDLRTRSAYMIGNRVRIDFGPDSLMHQHTYGLAYEELEHLLITHSHDDHFFPSDLAYRRAGFSDVGGRTLRMWGNEKVGQRYVESNGSDWSRYRIEFHRAAAWQRIDLGGGMTATPVLASHDPAEECLNYLIEVGGRTALFGHDTGWYCEATWQFLSDHPIDVLILDCTYGSIDHNDGHLGCSWVVRVRDELAVRGALSSGATVVANHFSHNGGWCQDDLDRFFTPYGILTAFDGMRLTL